jgi:hypothetical protein
MKAELRVGIEIILGQEPIDELESGADTHGRAIRL